MTRASGQVFGDLPQRPARGALCPSGGGLRPDRDTFAEFPGLFPAFPLALPEEPEWDSEVEDAGIKFLWRRLGDIAIDENECIDSNFYIWPEGTPREEIWRWFDARYSKGVAHLMGIAG